MHYSYTKYHRNRFYARIFKIDLIITGIDAHSLLNSNINNNSNKAFNNIETNCVQSTQVCTIITPNYRNRYCASIFKIHLIITSRNAHSLFNSNINKNRTKHLTTLRPTAFEAHKCVLFIHQLLLKLVLREYF